MHFDSMFGRSIVIAMQEKIMRNLARDGKQLLKWNVTNLVHLWQSLDFRDKII